MKGATQTVRIASLLKGVTARVKEASWSCNLPFVVLGVMVAAAEKCSVFGLEPSIVWSVEEPGEAGPRSILLRIHPR
jgi:hypothetical protein